MTTNLDSGQQDSILQQITSLLVFSLPPGWEQTELTYRRTGSTPYTACKVVSLAGKTLNFNPPPELWERLTLLQTRMTGPAAWQSARFTLQYYNSYTIDYDREPPAQPASAPPPPHSSEPALPRPQAQPPSQPQPSQSNVFHRPPEPTTPHHTLGASSAAKDPAARNGHSLVLPTQHSAPPPSAPQQSAPPEPEDSSATTPTARKPPSATGSTAMPDKTALRLLETALREHGVNPQAYLVGAHTQQAWCLEPVESGRWQVAWWDNGEAADPVLFDRLPEAAAHLLGTLLLVPTRATANTEPPQTQESLADWPIQPTGGDPPLTLYRQKRLVVLPAGSELDRYGPSTGNACYQAGTDFSQMSLREAKREHGLRRYRVHRALWVLSGVSVPWHEQPGGGAAYLLPHSIDQHLTNQSLLDITPN